MDRLITLVRGQISDSLWILGNGVSSLGLIFGRVALKGADNPVNFGLSRLNQY